MEILAWVVLSTLIGAAMGQTRGRTADGLVLGLLLGPIGWVIAFMLRDLRPVPRPIVGWHPDPTRRHEERYFDGREWSSAVADDSITGVDDPDPGMLPPRPDDDEPRRRGMRGWLGLPDLRIPRAVWVWGAVLIGLGLLIWAAVR